MGKKKQGKGKVVVESTNLEQFIATEERKEREKEARTGKPAEQAPVVNPCKQRLEQMLKAHNEARREETKTLFSETINGFGYLDNKLIEAYAFELSHFSKEETSEMMEQPQFCHFMRHQLRELQFLINLPFVQFWFELLKDGKLIEFFDSLLLNFRKFDDTYKL